MSDEQRVQAIQELIISQYESMGYAILSINGFGPGTFKAEIIDANGIKEVLVTVLLHMVPINAIN